MDCGMNKIIQWEGRLLLLRYAILTLSCILEDVFSSFFGQA